MKKKSDEAAEKARVAEAKKTAEEIEMKKKKFLEKAKNKVKITNPAYERVLVKE